MKTLDFGFAVDGLRVVGIYSTSGYSICDIEKYRKLIIYKYGKEIGSSHVFSLDGCCSNGLVDYDISISSPTILATCEFSHVKGTDYLTGAKSFLINFYNITDGITEETLPIATYRISGISEKYPRISFVNDFKLVILTPCESFVNNVYKILVIDLIGMRVIIETDEFQVNEQPWYLSVNEKYISFMTFEKDRCWYCHIYNKETLVLVNKFNVGNCITSSLIMDATEKVITRSSGSLNVFDIKGGMMEFSISTAQIKLLMPVILRDIRNCDF